MSPRDRTSAVISFAIVLPVDPVMHTIVGGAEWFRTVPETSYLGVLPYFHVTGMQNSMNTPTEFGVRAMSAMLAAASTMIGSRTDRMPHRSISHPTNGMAIAEEIAARPPAAEMLARSQPNS